MRYLLDTHSFLWSLFNPERLSAPAKKAIRDPENEIGVSVVTFWEISLKYALGKLELKNATPDNLPQVAEDMGLEIIQLTPQEAASCHKLPRLAHKDPFDRLIIWQAIQRKMILVSRDREFMEYKQHGLKVYW